MNSTFAILFVVLACGVAVSSAYPERYTIDRFDDNYPVVFDDRHVDDYRNSRLRRQYYGGDEAYQRGYYPSFSSNTAPIRREDNNLERGLKFTPLVRYKSTRTKRKKLFVPNLWG